MRCGVASPPARRGAGGDPAVTRRRRSCGGVCWYDGAGRRREGAFRSLPRSAGGGRTRTSGWSAQRVPGSMRRRRSDSSAASRGDPEATCHPLPPLQLRECRGAGKRRCAEVDGGCLGGGSHAGRQARRSACRCRPRCFVIQQPWHGGCRRGYGTLPPLWSTADVRSRTSARRPQRVLGSRCLRGTRASGLL